MTNSQLIRWCEEELGLEVESVYKYEGVQFITALPTCFDSWGFQFASIVQAFGWRNVHTEQYREDKVKIEIAIK